MSELKINENTKDQAIEYADNEAEIQGFKRGSPKWQNMVAKYIEFAIGTMAVGRNPRGYRYKIYTTLYPEVFSSSGWAGQVAKNYATQEKEPGVPVKEIENRILAALTNISKMFENGILNLRTTTIGNAQGKIDVLNVSDFQFPEKGSMSDTAYKEAVQDVLKAWVTRDLSITILLECLKPFMKLTDSDFQRIADKINLDAINMSDIKKGQRETFIREVKRVLAPTFDKIDIMKILG